MKRVTYKILLTLYILALFAAGGFCGYYGFRFVFRDMMETGSAFLAYLLLLLTLYASLLLQVILHEAGHLIFGSITGYHFLSFRIGPFMLVRDKGKMRLRLFSLQGTGGQCLMRPPCIPRDRIPYLLYNLGGSIVNLLTAAAAFAICYFTEKNTYTSFFFFVLALAGLICGLGNGIPLRLKYMDNDGYNAYFIHKHKSAKPCLWIQMQVVCEISQGVRLKDMPSEWFFIPESSLLDSGICAVIAVFACSREIDAMRFEAAGKMIRELLENKNFRNILYRNMLHCELLFCELVGENRQAELKRIRTENFQKLVKKMEKSNISVCRVQYAYQLLGKRNPKAAEKKLAAFEKAARVHPYACEVEGERELIAYVQTLYQQSATPAEIIQ